ncbi:MAG: hypothetical protein KGJ60_09965 [Verrucomicrobiota bacterium]|nr:hypothetical protein [Verrucomicrobiota bacterium]
MTHALPRHGLLLAILILSGRIGAAGFGKILVPPSCPPAVQSAAQILAQKLSLPDAAIQAAPTPAVPGAGELVLATVPATAAQARWLGSTPKKIKQDGYAIVFKNGGALICGARPRSLLYAAGDLALWKNRASGVWVRNPAFAIRAAPCYGHLSVAEYVARMGVNLIIGNRGGQWGSPVTFQHSLPEVWRQLSEADQQQQEWQSRAVEQESARFARECHDADVAYYPFLYGNDFRLWSPALYDAVLKAHPSVRGTPAPDSWEKATLCPSDPLTWKVIDVYVREFVEKMHGDGLYATFWDRYGLYCQDQRCVSDGLNQFSNELYECVKHYHDVLAPLGKKLIVRTWSSGSPHWYGGQWVHAPGYGGFGGEGTNLWERVIRELPAEITLQTKVYNSDCQPAPPFSALLGHAPPHAEIAEYQITGQTTGRFYFPASTVDYTDWTMKKCLKLAGPDGGVSVFPGGTGQSNYSLFDDILNSINLYAWRELSWQVDANVNRIWRDWATPIYGPRAAPHIIQALRLSEDAVNHLFSTLGMGNDTNSGFPDTIQRRETLLKYTNRYDQPDYARFLEPTRENIRRVIAEKERCLKEIDEMFRQLDLAKPYLTRAQADELTTRFNWLEQFALVNANLEESLWRYRYLRYEATMLTTDPEQMKFLAQAYDAVQAHQKLLFQFDPAQQFSCYDVPLGQLRRRPSLGNPLPLMKQLYQASEQCVESAVGPDYLPKAWLR